MIKKSSYIEFFPYPKFRLIEPRVVKIVEIKMEYYQKSAHNKSHIQ